SRAARVVLERLTQRVPLSAHALPSPFRPQAVPRLQRPACLARLRRSSFTTRQATGRRTGGHPPFSGGSEDPPIEGVPPTRGSGRLQGRQIASPSLANPVSTAA